MFELLSESQFSTATLEHLQAQAEDGDSEARVALARRLISGLEPELDPVRGAQLLESAAEQGSLNALYNLGVIYSSLGAGVPSDLKTAAAWLRTAAERGLPIAQYELGGRYFGGKGVPRDYTEAVKWFRLAAEQGFAAAQTNLGAMCERGLCSGLGLAEAFKWYRIAANQGDAIAQVNIGNMLCKGKGVDWDDLEAEKWFAAAADQGFAEGQYRYGLFCYCGRSSLGHTDEARQTGERYLSLAADQNHGEARRAIYGIRRGLPVVFDQSFD